jgi:protein-S-isoprenylcysteine O-methyltransferase Ste14
MYIAFRKTLVFHIVHQEYAVTLNQFLFRNRSYTPIPFLVAMCILAQPNPVSMVAGFLVLSAGELIRAWGVFYVGSETRVTHQVGASRLVTSGAFGHVRNPLYTGNILIYVGVGIMANAWTPWLQCIALVFFIFQYSLIVREEERFLLKEFGEEYRRYCEEVPRFAFRIKQYRSTGGNIIDWKAGWASETRSLQAIAVVVAVIVTIWMIR